eukprot:scaffold4170_cov63-Phaeocystis_antarctica.AAC.15
MVCAPPAAPSCSAQRTTQPSGAGCWREARRLRTARRYAAALRHAGPLPLLASHVGHCGEQGGLARARALQRAHRRRTRRGGRGSTGGLLFGWRRGEAEEGGVIAATRDEQYRGGGAQRAGHIAVETRRAAARGGGGGCAPHVEGGGRVAVLGRGEARAVRLSRRELPHVQRGERSHEARRRFVATHRTVPELAAPAAAPCRPPHAGSSHPFAPSAATPVSFEGSLSEGVASEGLIRRKAFLKPLRLKAAGDLVTTVATPNGRRSAVGVAHGVASFDVAGMAHSGGVDQGVVACAGEVHAGTTAASATAAAAAAATAAFAALAATSTTVGGGGPSSVGVQCGRRNGSRASGKLLPSPSALVVRPRPSWPSPPAPKTYSAPRTVTTAECACPAATPRARIASNLRSRRKLAIGVGGWLGPRLGPRLGSSAGPSGCSLTIAMTQLARAAAAPRPHDPGLRQGQAVRATARQLHKAGRRDGQLAGSCERPWRAPDAALFCSEKEAAFVVDGHGSDAQLAWLRVLFVLHATKDAALAPLTPSVPQEG